MHSTLIKAQDFLRMYAAIDPTARSRFRNRRNAESFDGLRVVQHAPHCTCFFVREQAERFLDRKRRELEEPPPPPVRSYDLRSSVQLMLDSGFPEVAEALARSERRRERRAAQRL